MRPSFRREMAQQAVAVRGVSIALACRAFAISQRCYRYAPLLADENEKPKITKAILRTKYTTPITTRQRP